MIARLSARADAARVAARADDRALLQRGAVGHREPHRDLGRDVDVREAAHAAPAEQRARALALPHDRRGDERAGLDRLERVDLHRRVDDRVRRRRSTRRRSRRPPRCARASRMSFARPITAPRSRADGPDVARGRARRVRSSCASAFTTTSAPSTVYGREHGARLDAGVVADEHRAVDARRRARRRRPRRSTRPRGAGSRASRAAPGRRAGPRARCGTPRACRRPPSSRRPRARAASGRRSSTAGNTSPEKSTTSPSGMKSNTPGSST